MNQDYVSPSVGSDGFSCPFCNAYAGQKWYRARVQPVGVEHINPGPEAKLALAGGSGHAREVLNLFVSQCDRCNDMAVWLHERLVWPVTGTAPVPNPDLPVDVRVDYEEASAIASESPRGAAALLRLAIEKLCKTLVPAKDNINDAIAVLVKKGLNVQVQQAMDVLRVVGNSAVHPGQMDLKDDTKTVGALFALVNLVAEAVITQPKLVSAMYEGLPADQLARIENRDGKAGQRG